MLGIVLCGHGGFASGLASAMTQIIGQQPQFIAIDFPVGASSTQLTHQCETAIRTLEGDEGVVFLTDLLGGTPFRVTATLALQKPGREVIAGTNLQLLVEMMLERDSLSSETFRLLALACGHRGLTSLSDEQVRERAVNHPTSGI